MPENERHQNLKNEILQWLQEDAQPQFGHHRNEVAFQCDDHIHFWRVPPWVAFVDDERRMRHPKGGHFQPDVTLLDHKGNPVAVLEVKDTNRVNKVNSAARMLGIPYFRFDCPPVGATANELWVRQQEMPWYREKDTGFHASWEGEVGEDGQTVYSRPIHLAGNQPGKVVMGPIAWANATNLTCAGATWFQHQEDGLGWSVHYRDLRAETAQEIGQNLLWEIESQRRNPHHWSAGIGDVQLAGTIGIYPLNRDLETGKYLPCDITSLLDKWGSETVAMHKALADRNQSQRPKPCQMFR